MNISGSKQTLNYKGKLENHSGFTTIKFREAEGMVKRTIDYMFLLENKCFHRSEIIVMQRLEIPDQGID